MGILSKTSLTAKSTDGEEITLHGLQVSGRIMILFSAQGKLLRPIPSAFSSGNFLIARFRPQHSNSWTPGSLTVSLVRLSYRAREAVYRVLFLIPVILLVLLWERRKAYPRSSRKKAKMVEGNVS